MGRGGAFGGCVREEERVILRQAVALLNPTDQLVFFTDDDLPPPLARPPLRLIVSGAARRLLALIYRGGVPERAHRDRRKLVCEPPGAIIAPTAF